MAKDVGAARQERLAEFKRRHDTGDRRAVLDALFDCFFAPPAKPVPEWARKAFRDAYGEVFAARVGSWDEVFGKPKGHLKQRRRRKELEFPVWKRVRSLHARGEAIGDEMFTAVGKEFGVGARQAKSMFYGCEKAFGYRSNLWGPPRDRRRRVSVPTS